MQIRLRNVLAIGALTSGLLAGGALVANAATTSTTTGNSGSSSSSNFVDDHTRVGHELRELRYGQHELGVLEQLLGLGLQFGLGLQLDAQLPQHGQRLGLPHGHASGRLWHPAVLRHDPGVVTASLLYPSPRP